MSEFLGIFAFSGAVCAIFWVWVFIETYGERKSDKALGINKEDMPFVATPSDVFRKLSRKHGLRLTRVHDLRHLHATELLRQGEPLHVVANRLGHRDAMTTATIYAHVSNEQAETASLSFATAFNNG